MSRVIISDKLQLAYYVVFKVASRSIIESISKADKHLQKFDIPRWAQLKITTLSCVRNPYDRVVSLYSYLRQKKDDKRPHLEQTQNKILTSLGISLGTFDELCNAIVNIEPKQANVHYRPQSLTLPTHGIDILLRFESINYDWENLRQKFPLPALTKKNPTDHKPYDSYYSEKTKQLIFTYYKEDFERFGYGTN